ncbi:MOSC domain-containing protein YiiM [Comamonas sp. BIGb0152]|uniref:MOSC domain-containing protein n=1 Tax=Comamonas sp. BIGb0152 TaxID=2940601 RepID=UPI0021679247|nr:MOSC domain-containing protein [Comamonas sp. BIGb0152]MCS4295179.1 MOSC domain-containing protein YiiM [Comamonas sp. BIGb0152]
MATLQDSWQPMGSLQRLYVRVGKEPEPRSVADVQAVSGHGLAGDRHASLLSPRQLLIAGDDAYRRWGLVEASLRENLRVDFSTSGLASGDLLRIGSDVVIWITFVCEPCRLLERRAPGSLSKIGRDRGMLARVLRGGIIHSGAEISVCPAMVPALSDHWQERVIQVARAVPEGAWISYRQLAEMAGVHTAYCRAFPKVLSQLPERVAKRVGSPQRAAGAAPWSGAGFFGMAMD